MLLLQQYPFRCLLSTMACAKICTYVLSLPLQIATDILAIGTITALLLALLGDLLASWLSARTRLTNFAVLRALGTTQQQVIGVLTWEQGVVYITGLLLGLTFAFTVIPTLTLTDLNTTISSSAFYYLQSSISTQVVLPSSLPIVLLVLALTMMVRVVSSSALSQTLRLNED